ncbi:MAG TPA: AraC family transcriptional regulator [Steroidobacteraceae bacterium]|nr:AraC family transcriptional regulator [Steroidobacteraceae bacterium]
MSHSGAYGRGFGEKFGLAEVPSLLTRVLRKADVAVTEVRSDDPVPRYTEAMPREDAYLVAVQLREFPRHEYWEEGRQVPVHDLLAGQTTFYDLKRNPVACIDKPYHGIFFYIPRTAFNLVADELNAARIGELDYRPGAGVSDPTTLSLAQSLRAALAEPQRATRLFVDHVTLALATHVAQTYGGLVPPIEPIRGGLAPWQLRRAKELLTANLDGALSVREIARECGVSVSHFSRAFRVSAGMAPHSWLLGRRVERARSLLPNRRLSLSEVALACGFADQSHFTRIFTREVGVSPGTWRRTLGGP